MLRFETIAVFVMLIVAGSLVSCSGGSSFISDPVMQPAAESQVDEMQPGAMEAGIGLPAFPGESSGAPPIQRELSWVYNVDPTAPLLQHRTYNCPVHPQGLVLEGLYTMPVTHLPPRPYFSYAFYEVPLGASAAGLLSMKITAEVSAAGEEYYFGLANYTAMHWEWDGPLGSAADYTVDFPALGYDFTSPGDSMYFVIVAPQANRLHLEEIQLNFDDGEDPTWWNVWGRAFNNYSAGSVLGGHTVEFEDIVTSTVYTTGTAADGNWGTNVPSGTYKFNIIGNEMLFDPAAYAVIENLPVIVEVNAGNIIYHGPNAAYNGTIIPMPLITVNSY